MFKFLSIILCCFVFLFKESYAGVWCSDGTLESLIMCLLQTNIQPNAVLWSRVECAKQARCTPKPWDFFDDNIRSVKDFVECMEDMKPWKDGKVLVMIDYKCRKELATNLPDHFKSYTIMLVPEGM